jgi:hypothetical protein
MSAAIIPLITWRTSRHLDQMHSLLFSGVHVSDLQAEIRRARSSLPEFGDLLNTPPASDVELANLQKAG